MSPAKNIWKIILIMALSAMGLVMYSLLATDEEAIEPFPPESANGFIQLCAYAKPETLRQALEQGASPNARWEAPAQHAEGHTFISVGESALEIALKYNPHLESIRLLLDAGAEVNGPSGRPLAEAVQRNAPELVALLLERGASVTAVDPRDEWGILLHADSESPAIVEMLLKAGANIHLTTMTGQTALHFAVMSDSEETVRLLLNAGIAPNVTDKSGNTPLHTLVKSPSIVETMAGYGADVNLENNDGLTPIEFNDDSARNFSIKPVPGVVEAFVAAGAQLFKQDDRGRKVARGFANDGTGYAYTRFFAADDCDLVSASIESASALRKKVLSVVSLESAHPGDEAPEFPKYKLAISWLDEDSKEPLEGLSYFLESTGGIAISGTTKAGGLTVSFYTPNEETVRSYEFADAREVIAQYFSPDTQRLPGGKAAKHKGNTPGPSLVKASAKHGERICFVHPEKRLPVSEYPYAVVSTDGYAIAGQTERNGCTAEFFTPGQGAFAVYGGVNVMEW